ncbi:hypothetical protein AWC38_SpisGene14995 [Stylophora pistillata]|uniref:FLYWCH-type domain-containing protein n=2 Tax=Stylophora pistillata TaxID=50429 RepID=A0A2B4RVF7_STYPI|nr:hypothetical protein AWC38_SpisGene14995 [Stylophora pistillata]
MAEAEPALESDPSVAQPFDLSDAAWPASELYTPTTPPTDLSVAGEPDIKYSLCQVDPTTPVFPTHVPLTFTLVEKATKRRGDRLIDSMGFSYNIRRKGAKTTCWQCTIRRKGCYCKAGVVERNGVFTFGNFSHNHEPPKPRAKTPSRKTKTKAKVVVEQFKPEPTTTDEVFQENLQPASTVFQALPEPCGSIEHSFTVINRNATQLLPNNNQSGLVESVIQTSQSTPVPPANVPLTYHLVEEASLRRRNKLIDSKGFSYNVRRIKGVKTYWQCSVRPKGNHCKATVLEQDGLYTFGQHPHNHGTYSGTLTAAQIVSTIKTKALEDLSKRASVIVRETLQEALPITSVCPALPKVDHIVRAVNRLRQKMRSEDVKDLNFSLKEDVIPPGFYQGEVKVKKQRHLIFATEQQLNLLAAAKSWYIDRIDKMVKVPFHQLISISTFVMSVESAKQVPLAFILMSSRKKRDYKKILREMIHLLPGEWLHVHFVTADFDEALWGALRCVVPHVKLQGCAFHWTQSVWKKMQDLGLQSMCTDHNGMHKYLRKLLALPLLPGKEISTQFQRLKLQATTETLWELINYIEDTWITNIAYPIRDWSSYHQPIRTMDDIEGWQKVLNGETSRKCQVPFYTLVQSLYRVAQISVQNMQLVSNKKLIRIQGQDCHHLQKPISQYWTEYRKKEITAAKLLKLCSKLSGSPPNCCQS